MGDLVMASYSRYAGHRCAKALAIGAIIASGLIGVAQAQVISCANPVGIPALPPQFNNWGPAAVCSVAGSAASLNSVITSANTIFLTQTSAFVGSPTDRAANTTGGGLWVRGVGGQTNFNSTGTVSASGLGLPFSGLTVDAASRSDFGGVQAGADLGRFNLGASGWNVHAGVTGGYLRADNRDKGGAGSSRFDIPFIGLYANLVHASGFFADLQVRGDFYDMRTSNPLVGANNEKFTARGVSLTGSAGFHYAVNPQFFIEPSAGFVWSNVSASGLQIPGGGPFGVPSGLASFDDVKGLLGRAGVRVGTNVSVLGYAVQPFAVASVWHEFEDNNTSHFVCTGCGFSIDLSTTRVGTYGQFGVGFSAALPNTGWLGYARADYRTGQHIEGWGLNAGLRYQWDQGPTVVAVKY